MKPQKETAARRAARVRVIQVTAFLLVFFVMSAIALMIPFRPKHSEMEGRELTSFPKLTLSSLVDGSFFDGVNLWFADTFPFRDGFMGMSNTIKDLYGSAKDDMQVFGEVGKADTIPTVNRTTTAPQMTFPTSPAPAVGQHLQNGGSGETQSTKPPSASGGQADAPKQQFGAVLTIGDSGFEYYHYTQSVADSYVATVNSAADQLKGIADVYDMIVPTSMDICIAEDVRSDVNSSNQKDAIDYFYASMNKNVKVVDIYDALKTAQNNGEYLYFRTDHHWTAMGAYRAYEQFCNSRGRAPTPLSAFTLVEYGGYLGSFYRQTELAAMKSNPDIVQAFVPPSTNSMSITDSSGNEFEYSIVTDVSEWSSLYKYNTFIGADNPYSVIKNPNKSDGSACLLIKESFGNAYAPFLVEDYETVYVIDYRYFSSIDSRNLKTFVTDNGVQDVLFLNNISATRNAGLVDSLKAFVN